MFNPLIDCVCRNRVCQVAKGKVLTFEVFYPTTALMGQKAKAHLKVSGEIIVQRMEGEGAEGERQSTFLSTT